MFPVALNQRQEAAEKFGPANINTSISDSGAVGAKVDEVLLKLWHLAYTTRRDPKVEAGSYVGFAQLDLA